jgi:hypothetical protein
VAPVEVKERDEDDEFGGGYAFPGCDKSQKYPEGRRLHPVDENCSLIFLRCGDSMKFIAEAIVVSTVNNEIVVEMVRRSTVDQLKRDSVTDATGTCRVAGTTDDPEHPFCEQNDCSGTCALQRTELGNGRVAFFCACGDLA